MKSFDPNSLTASERMTLVTLRAFQGSLPLADVLGKWRRAGLVDDRGLLTPAGEKLADKVAKADGFKTPWKTGG